MHSQEEAGASGQQDARNSTAWPPGTLALEDLQRSGNSVILHPVPTSDPNDPLNWSSMRKHLNFALVSLYVLLTFVQLDIGFTAWEQYQEELGFDVNMMNGSAAINYAGLAVGCIFFVPLVHKFGRRPMYILSTVAQLLSSVWFAHTYTVGDLYGSNLLSGLGGAISETIVQITIADLFFVHHHAAMNGWYLFATFTGAYLGPVASGYIVDNQGWRWMWWWCVILFSINLLLILFFFEESKYTGSTSVEGVPPSQEVTHEDGESGKPTTELAEHAELHTSSSVRLDESIPVKSYWQRLAWVTPTKGSMLHHFYQPMVIMFTFPAIAYTAISYGTLLAWFAILTSVQATYLFSPPYNFSAAGVGLMNLAPFVGSVPGILIGGHLNDRSILWLSRRNNGIYEPEMRLWLALPFAIVTPAGILMFGLGLHYQAPWPLLAVGFGVFGFGLVGAGDIALSYAMDCYHDIIGNALVGVVFTRNAISVVVLFALTPWLDGMGIRDVHIIVSVICFVIMLLPVPLLVWGKAARVKTTDSYHRMALRQPTRRDWR